MQAGAPPTDAAAAPDANQRSRPVSSSEPTLINEPPSPLKFEYLKGHTDWSLNAFDEDTDLFTHEESENYIIKLIISFLLVPYRWWNGLNIFAHGKDVKYVQHVLAFAKKR